MISLVEIAFYKSDKTLLDKGIRFFSKSPYSHCEIVFNREFAISASGRDGGTRIKKADQMNFDDGNKWDFYKIDLNLDIDKIYDFDRVYKGKYDFVSIVLYHMLRIPINIKNKYICSEYCFMIINEYSNNSNKKTLDTFLKLYFGNRSYKLNPSNLLLILEMSRLISRT